MKRRSFSRRRAIKPKNRPFFKVPAPLVDEKQTTLHCPVNIPEKEQEVPSEKSETSDSQPPEGKQKTLNLGFDISPEPPEKEEASEKKLSEDPVPEEDNFFPLPKSMQEKKLISEPVEKKTLSTTSKKKGSDGSIDPSKQRTSDKASPSAGMQDNTGEVLKKAEPKNQKTLFDF
ncbi:hypothetical protein [Methanosarcina horonobensis]|uniref:hypothetical protein n=1 Tax=Methanosarcina horonobensis TaxID=418008 RepID=UPI0022B8B5F9|nr:hypothetical protein [Methanosarcina horonobensis]